MAQPSLIEPPYPCSRSGHGAGVAACPCRGDVLDAGVAVVCAACRRRDVVMKRCRDAVYRLPVRAVTVMR